MVQENDIELIAKQYAEKCHTQTNHFYDGNKPYMFHLNMVKKAAEQFCYLIPKAHRPLVYAGCYVHDCIEDTRQTKNDVAKATNEFVAELSYALANEKGRNRAERANEKYYKGIRQTKYAVFIKLCDRIANVQYSLQAGADNSMLKKYRAENQKFIYELFKGDGFKHSLLRLLLPKSTYITRQIINSPYFDMVNTLHVLLWVE